MITKILVYVPDFYIDFGQSTQNWFYQFLYKLPAHIHIVSIWMQHWMWRVRATYVMIMLKHLQNWSFKCHDHLNESWLVTIIPLALLVIIFICWFCKTSLYCFTFIYINKFWMVHILESTIYTKKIWSIIDRCCVVCLNLLHRMFYADAKTCVMYGPRQVLTK